MDLFFECCSWLENFSFLTRINDTLIALIPKLDNLKTIRDFRHISLGNVLYKIISKVLANGLKLIYMILL